MALNYAVASSNRILAENLIKAQRAGLVSREWTAKATEVQFKIADKQQALNGILKAGPAAAKLQGPAIRSILQEITNLAASVKSGSTGETETRIAAIIGMADQILSFLELAGIVTS